MNKGREKVLVIGGSGFVGSHLFSALKEEYDPVSFSSKELDITKRDSFKIIPKDVEIVFSLAADISLDDSQKVFDSLFSVNVIGTKNILEWCRKNSIRRVIHSSSVFVYPKPKSFYALSKKMAEDLCFYYKNQYGLDVVVLRYSSVYGKGQKQNSVLPIFVKQAMAGEDILVYGKGKRRQNFVYVKDVVEANVLAARSKTRERLFNICSQKDSNMRELAETVKKVFGSKSTIVIEKSEEEGESMVKESLADEERELGFRQKYSLEKGLRDLRKETE